jgi:hypothetical protein
MSERIKGQLSIIQNIVVIVTLPLLLGLGGWVFHTIIEHENSIAVLEAEANRGSRYTTEDAETRRIVVDESMRNLTSAVSENSKSIHQLALKIAELRPPD